MSTQSKSQFDIEQLIALFNEGKYEELETCSVAMLERYPDMGIVWNLLGVSRRRQGKDAVSALQSAASLLPDDHVVHNSLGNALKDIGKFEEAIECYRTAIKLQHDYADAHNNMGLVLMDCGRLDDAVESYRQAITFAQDFPGAYYNLGIALSKQGKHEESVLSYRRTLDFWPGFDGARYNLGNELYGMGRLAEAEECFRMVIEITPEFPDSYCNLGNVLKDQGRLLEAVASYRKALEIAPGFLEARSNLLFVLNCLTGKRALNNFVEAREYGRIASSKVTEAFSTWKCITEPDRLTVGVVSGDMRNHSVGHFIENVLAQLDPRHIQLIAYPTTLMDDELTERIKPHFCAWKPLANLSDENAANIIHSDGVHILLDLSGHTAHNRLAVFAWRPSPVQATWLGYFATTGLAEMDYLLADEVSVPETHYSDFTEKVWCLPGTRMCFTPPPFALPVSPMPALRNGYITFGCFQPLLKVGDEVLSVWAKIMSAIPESHLRWQCKQFTDPVVREEVIARMSKHGIDSERVAILDSVPWREYLLAYSEVDLILDTFPYTGGTTTCEALWMGIPTLTMAGETLLSRQGASLLTAAGLGDWVVQNVDEYIKEAISLSKDLPRMAELRAGLRQYVSGSLVFDAKHFAKNLEDGLWGMWSRKQIQSR